MSRKLLRRFRSPLINLRHLRRDNLRFQRLHLEEIHREVRPKPKPKPEDTCMVWHGRTLYIDGRLRRI